MPDNPEVCEPPQGTVWIVSHLDRLDQRRKQAAYSTHAEAVARYQILRSAAFAGDVRIVTRFPDQAPAVVDALSEETP